MSFSLSIIGPTDTESLAVWEPPSKGLKLNYQHIFLLWDGHVCPAFLAPGTKFRIFAAYFMGENFDAMFKEVVSASVPMFVFN